MYLRIYSKTMFHRGKIQKYPFNARDIQPARHLNIFWCRNKFLNVFGQSWSQLANNTARDEIQLTASCNARAALWSWSLESCVNYEVLCSSQRARRLKFTTSNWQRSCRIHRLTKSGLQICDPCWRMERITQDTSNVRNETWRAFFSVSHMEHFCHLKFDLST